MRESPSKSIKNPSVVLNQSDNSVVRFIDIDAAHEGQRLDNFLLSVSKGVPKSHIYRIVRGGEVRINKKRATVSQRLNLGDCVRIPPMRIAQKEAQTSARPFGEGELTILFEDRDLLIVNKPAGLACHGGSGVSFGLIERLRATRPETPMLELAHRLDRDTSGILVLCKTRKALVRFQEAIREGTVHKFYRLLVVGDWVNEREHVKAPLTKYTLPSGERRVRVDQENGLFSHTIFTLLHRFGPVSYLEAELKTGRTHQIRVHASSVGFPLVGDSKYGDYAVNGAVAKGSLGVPFKRLYLHSYRLAFTHPVLGTPVKIVCPEPEECERLLTALKLKE